MVNKIGLWRGSVPARALTREAAGSCRLKQKEEELCKQEGRGGPLPLRSRALAWLSCLQSYSFTFTKRWFLFFPPAKPDCKDNPRKQFLCGVYCDLSLCSCFLCLMHGQIFCFWAWKLNFTKNQWYVSLGFFLTRLLQGCWCRHERGSGWSWSTIHAPVYASCETMPCWLGLPLVFLWLLIYTLLQ